MVLTDMPGQAMMLLWSRAVKLNAGNLAAWFTAKVTASLDDKEYTAYLGGCSYNSFKGFRNSDYFEDLQQEAIIGLAEEIMRGN